MIIGISLIFLAISTWIILPFSFPMGLGWLPEVILVLKGGLPIIGIMISLIALFIGIADIKDRVATKKVKEKDSN